MKALNLLIELRENDRNIFGATPEQLKVYDEAIEELENISSLQSTRSCDGCKHRITGNRYYDCLFEDCLRFPLLRGFTDMYEAKDKE